jgi:hypothetical protein
MIKVLKQKLVWLRNFIIYKKYAFSAKINRSEFRKNIEANFVVSIASYPKRSHLLPSVFEALNNQTTVPQKWILVLSEEEWPNLNLPSFLKKLEKRGVEIIWVKNNTYAVKKLVPVIEKYPDLGVITFDDELIYGKSVIDKLVKCSEINKEAIIGHVGKQLIQKDSELKMHYRLKEIANQDTPSEQVYFLGGSGTFYPPNSLDQKVTQIEGIQNIVPGRGSDIWFWAAAVARDTKQICLGSKANRSLFFSIPSTKNTEPKDTPGKDIIEQRFQKTIDFFEIRQKLIETLPNIISKH